ncbi:MAG: hypothetical protein DRO39_00470 [Thermoprotei archaeon]|nr:MAG: hypothetical protein DRO39_00470 [Thermoprotei archaeon]
MARSRYTKYRLVAEPLGLKQLDVYRSGKREIVRLMDIRTGKVYVVELPRPRNEIPLDEYEAFLKKAIGLR